MVWTTSNGTTMTIHWDSMNTSDITASNYNVEVYINSQSSSNLRGAAYSLYPLTRQYNFTNLIVGSTYVARVYARMSDGTTKSESITVNL